MYRNFQFIAYRTPTNGLEDRTGLGPGPLPPISGASEALLKAQVGAATPSDDLNARLRRMIKVIEIAKEKADPLSSTLKIFVAPEFYFRPKTGLTQRSYSEGDKEYLSNALNMFQDESFKGWLFVCGTVVWEQYNVAHQQTVAWNTAFILEGGKSGRFLVHKRIYATPDAINRETSPLRVSGKIEELRGYVDPVHAVFQIAGYWMGLEICMDHDSLLLRQGVPKRAKRDNVPTLKERGLAVQILTACGMNVQPGALYLDKERSIVRVDGDQRGAEPRSEIVRVLEVRAPGSPRSEHCVALETSAETPPFKVVALPADVQMEVTDPTALKYPQELAIYGLLPLPLRPPPPPPPSAP
ncbi:MAG: hypothetical protein R3B09_05805 [Nannocystaceae bacterium]